VLSYIAQRLLTAIPALLVVAVISFLVVHLLPGDPAVAMAGPDTTPEEIEAIRERLNLNEPLWTQFVLWFGKVMRGDFGRSIWHGVPVGTLLAQALPITGLLVAGGYALATILAFVMGTSAALARRKSTQASWAVILAVTYGIPGFWFAILLILLFSTTLHWFPTSGYANITENFGRAVWYMTLPWVVVGIKNGSMIARYVKSGLEEEMDTMYVTVARSKGLREWAVVWRHAMRNALIPVVTIIGMQIGLSLAGIIVQETIFNLPGLGRLTILSISQRDYPVIQTIILFVGAGFIIINLLVDLLYGYIDPRIKYD
jgi:peptide/nickel transport system permease protein